MSRNGISHTGEVRSVTAYQINLGRMAASRVRKTGGATTRLLIYRAADSDWIDWILLRSGDPDLAESWRNALKVPIEFGGYRLSRRSRPVTQTEKAHISKLQARLIADDLPAAEAYKIKTKLQKLATISATPRISWSWGYSSERNQYLRNAMASAIRAKREQEVNKLIHMLSHTIGFARAREQVHSVWELVDQEWRRAMKNGTPVPSLPKVGYVQRVKNKGWVLSDLVSDHRRQQRFSFAA